MKKLFLLMSLTFSILLFSQAKKPQKPKFETKVIEASLTIQQYDFLKSIKLKYPNFLIPDSKEITNIYINGELIQSQYFISDKSGTYSVTLQPNNIELSYEVDIININKYTGHFHLFNGIIVKTEITKTEFNVYFDGKKEL